MPLPLDRKVRTGCLGWSYEDWQGPFYPKEMAAKDYLRFYSNVFDVVELDSSFYSLPSSFLVDRWTGAAPAGFLFCPKLSKSITHDTKLRGVEPTLSVFYSIVKPLGEKLGPILVQPPIGQGGHSLRAA